MAEGQNRGSSICNRPFYPFCPLHVPKCKPRRFSLQCGYTMELKPFGHGPLVLTPKLAPFSDTNRPGGGPLKFFRCYVGTDVLCAAFRRAVATKRQVPYYGGHLFTMSGDSELQLLACRRVESIFGRCLVARARAPGTPKKYRSTYSPRIYAP